MQLKKPLMFVAILMLVLGFFFFVYGEYQQLVIITGGDETGRGTGGGDTGDPYYNPPWSPEENETETEQEQTPKWNLNFTVSLRILGFIFIIVALVILISGRA